MMDTITLKISETGGFSRGVASPCHFFHKDLETYILVHGDDFFMVGRQEGREYALSMLRSAHELSGVVTTDSEFLGQNTDIATMENRVRTRPAACFRRQEDFGIDRCEGRDDSCDVGGPKVSQISELRGTAKWHDPPEEGSQRGRRSSHWRRIEAVPECSGEIQFPCYGQARPLVISERAYAENGFATHTGPHCPQESCTIHDQIPANDLRISMDPTEQ